MCVVVGSLGNQIYMKANSGDFCEEVCNAVEIKQKGGCVIPV